MKIVIEKYYDDVTEVFTANDDYNSEKIEEYVREFVSIYKYVTFIKDNHIYIVIGDRDRFPSEMHLVDKTFRAWLHRKFNFESVNFDFV